MIVRCILIASGGCWPSRPGLAADPWPVTGSATTGLAVDSAALVAQAHPVDAAGWSATNIGVADALLGAECVILRLLMPHSTRLLLLVMRLLCPEEPALFRVLRCSLRPVLSSRFTLSGAPLADDPLPLPLNMPWYYQMTNCHMMTLWCSVECVQKFPSK